MESYKTLDNRLSEEFNRVEELWEQYRRDALKVIHEWEKERLPLVERLNVLRNLIKIYEKEIEELKLKVDLGLEDEKKASEKIDQLSKELEDFKNEYKTILEIIERYDKLSHIHLKRTGLPTKADAEEIKRRLSELDVMLQEGVIDEETYNQLKEELETFLKLL